MDGKLILLVDDESYVTTVVGQQLQRRGHQVLAGSDGEEALALAREHRPDLIVCDYQMPLMSGLEMAARLLQDPATAAIPVIMLTARGHRVPPSELAQTNIRNVLPKPFSIRELLATVHALLTGESDNAATPVREFA